MGLFQSVKGLSRRKTINSPAEKNSASRLLLDLNSNIGSSLVTIVTMSQFLKINLFLCVYTSHCFCFSGEPWPICIPYHNANILNYNLCVDYFHIEPWVITYNIVHICYLVPSLADLLDCKFFEDTWVFFPVCTPKLSNIVPDYLLTV